MIQCSDVNLVVHQLQSVRKKRRLKNTLAPVCLYPHKPGNQKREIQVMNELMNLQGLASNYTNTIMNQNYQGNDRQ